VALPTPAGVELFANVALFVAPVLLAGVARGRPLVVLVAAGGLSVVMEAIQAIAPAIGRSCDTNDWPVQHHRRSHRGRAGAGGAVPRGGTANLGQSASSLGSCTEASVPPLTKTATGCHACRVTDHWGTLMRAHRTNVHPIGRCRGVLRVLPTFGAGPRASDAMKERGLRSS
jgi:hypothetical protein